MQNNNEFEDSLHYVSKHYKKGVFDPDKAYKTVTGVNHNSFRNNRFIFRVAAIAVIVLVVSSILFINGDRDKTITAKSNQKIVVLPDQSEVTLQPNATLSFNKSFGKKIRDVSMDGNIAFKVTPNATKPFIVHTHNAAIRVIGTTFDVQSNQFYTHLNVTSGKVKFIIAFMIG